MNAAIDRADRAMAQCADKANRLHDGWTVQAHKLLRRYLSCWPTVTFLTEDFQSWAHLEGLPIPHDNRAMGGVMKSAARAGLIRRQGYATDKFCSPKTLWATGSRHD